MADSSGDASTWRICSVLLTCTNRKTGTRERNLSEDRLFLGPFRFPAGQGMKETSPEEREVTGPHDGASLDPPSI